MALCAAALGADALGADDWTLTTTDFRSRAVEFKAMNAAAVSLVESPATKPSNVDCSSVLSLSRPAPPSIPVTGFEVRLIDGERLIGQPEAIDGENLRWREDILGSMTTPLRDVALITRIGRLAQKGTATEDVATLTNGDVIRGAVNDLNARTVTIQRSDGTSAPIPIDSLAELHFASTAQATPATKPAGADGYFQVTLSDGSRLTAGDLDVAPPKASFISSDHVHRRISTDSLRGIDHVDGPVQWLSSMTPTEDIQVPLLDRPMPARFDRAVTGGAIQFGERIYQHGIGVHAYSRLSFAVGPRDRTFRTQFAVEGDSPYAELTVRIKLDGQTASETKAVRAGTLSPVITLDVSRAHTLTLEVEDPTGDNVQGRLNWIEPAMLRFTAGN